MQTTFSRSSLVLTLAAVCGLGALAGSFSRTSAAPSAVAPSAVAVVNIRQVMKTIKEYAALGEMQKGMLENLKKQGAAKDAELKTLQENAKLLTNGSDEWQKLDAQYAEKSMQLEAWGQFQKKQLARQEAAVLLGLYRKVCARAQKLAEDKGYDVLLAQNLTLEQLMKEVRLEETERIVNGDREVLWAKKSVDLTADLVAAMDNEFGLRGATAPAPALGPVVAPSAPAAPAAAPARPRPITVSAPSFTTAELAQRLGARLTGAGDLRIDSLADLAYASAGSLSFIGNAKYAPQWAGSLAQAAIVTEGLTPPERPGTALLFVKNADLAMAKALDLFAPPQPHAPVGVHPSASVDPTAQIGAQVSIGARAVVGPGAQIGDGSVLHAGAVVMENAVIGRQCTLFPNAVVYHRCTIGEHSILHGGAVIGADGFGYRAADDGKGLVKIPHIGSVRIGRGVEIGANSCVDRAKFDATVIGDGTKLDNLVQIGHNCRIGRCVVMAAGVAIGGSTVIGDGVQIGGGANLADHLTIGARARLAGGSSYMTDVPAGEDWGGTPGQPLRDYFRVVAALRRMPDLLKKAKKLGLLAD